MKHPLTVDRVMTSDGKHTTRAGKALPSHRANAAILCERVNALLDELGFVDVVVNDGYRDPLCPYGAKRSAHKDGAAVDLRDRDNAIALRCTQALLVKHKLRREDTRDAPTWCHLDTRQPYGIFRA